MSEQMVILVTGGYGLVGHALQAEMKKDQRSYEKWIFLKREDCDLMDRDKVMDVFKELKPTHVIHLAAKVCGLYGHRDVEGFVENNRINDNVLSASFNCNVQKVISCLSSCIFPDKTTYPIDETMIHDGPPHDSAFGYAYAKRMLDVMNRAFANQYGKMFTSVIPCNVFGPNDNFDIETCHAISGLIAKAYTAKKTGKPLEIWGTGKAMRQLIYSHDLGKLLIWAMRSYEEVSPLFCVPEDEISIKEATEVIAKCFNLKEEFVYNTERADGQMRKTASNAKLRSYLPDFQFTPFDEAIQQTVNWYWSNVNNLRKVVM